MFFHLQIYLLSKLNIFIHFWFHGEHSQKQYYAKNMQLQILIDIQEN